LFLAGLKFAFGAITGMITLACAIIGLLASAEWFMSRQGWRSQRNRSGRPASDAITTPSSQSLLGPNGSADSDDIEPRKIEYLQ